ncbi:MAG: hypothetical protein HOQ09_05380 [Gemmatimonadaceae bacterium]|nr:hypothetical protein [Gemmatimonadaceae bacterium]
MQKTYTTPRLVAQGEVLELTKASNPGTGDPIRGLQGVDVGSVGFQL